MGWFRKNRAEKEAAAAAKYRQEQLHEIATVIRDSKAAWGEELGLAKPGSRISREQNKVIYEYVNDLLPTRSPPVDAFIAGDNRSSLLRRARGMAITDAMMHGLKGESLEIRDTHAWESRDVLKKAYELHGFNSSTALENTGEDMRIIVAAIPSAFARVDLVGGMSGWKDVNPADPQLHRTWGKRLQEEGNRGTDTRAVGDPTPPIR